jgi:hypothetical protein
MSQQGRSGSGSASRYRADSPSTPRYIQTSPSVPRYMPPDRYERGNTYGASADSGTGQMNHYQLSSSHRGEVTNTGHFCVRACYYWACGHETTETRRHHLCWKCNNLDVGVCRPEPVDIDKTRECARCKARREEDRRRRDRQRAAARDRERQQDRRRERSPSGVSTWERRRSY